jgi:hypothetical protein
MTFENLTTQSPSKNAIERRQHDRVRGPFEGVRVDALRTPVRIFDLSLGGCFVTALHDQQPGITMVIRIQLPYVGPIAMKAVTLYRRPGGFAVKFVDMNGQTVRRLGHALDQLHADADRKLTESAIPEGAVPSTLVA